MLQFVSVFFQLGVEIQDGLCSLPNKPGARVRRLQARKIARQPAPLRASTNRRPRPLDPAALRPPPGDRAAHRNAASSALAPQTLQARLTGTPQGGARRRSEAPPRSTRS